MDLLKRLRWPNLLLMAFLLLSVRYFMMAPIFESYGLNLILNHLDVALLTLSCLLVGAGGYLINDYYDQEADVENGRPAMQQPAMVLRWYGILSVAGIALAAWVGFRAGLLNLAIINIIATFALWKYAESWKGIPLLGNLAVSGMLGLLIFVPLVYEYIAISVLYREAPQSARFLLYASVVYACFAYLTNLVRELAKTAQDVHGDAQAGYRTFAVVYGAAATRKLSVILMLVVLLGLLLVAYQQLVQQAWYNLGYLLFTVVLPAVWALVQLIQSKEAAQFAKASRSLKWLLLGGIGSMAWFYLQLIYF